MNDAEEKEWEGEDDVVLSDEYVVVEDEKDEGILFVKSTVMSLLNFSPKQVLHLLLFLFASLPLCHPSISSIFKTVINYNGFTINILLLV